MQNLTIEEKIYGLSKIWKEAEYNFAFWDKPNMPNWEEEYNKSLSKIIKTKSTYEYYMELKRFIYLLKDGHTDVYFPQNLQNEMFFLPIKLSYIERKHIISNIDESIKDKVEPYSEVLKINGINTLEYLEKYIYPYCWTAKLSSSYYFIDKILSIGKENSFETFELQTPKGKIKKIKLYRKNKKQNYKWIIDNHFISNSDYETIHNSKTLKIQKTKENILIITIPSFADADVVEEYYNNIDIIKKSNGIIFDIRKNEGGNSDYSNEIAQSLIDGEFETSFIKLRNHIGYYKAHADFQDFKNISKEDIIKNEELKKIYLMKNNSFYLENIDKFHNPKYNLKLKQPVVVLISELTASAAEDFLISLDNAKRITIVGTPSFGSTGQPIMFDLPGGGFCRICSIQCLYPNGKDIINKGVQPHIFTDLSVNDYINKNDSVLKIGLETIFDKINK